LCKHSQDKSNKGERILVYSPGKYLVIFRGNVIWFDKILKLIIFFLKLEYQPYSSGILFNFEIPKECGKHITDEMLEAQLSVYQC
jgi:hypothetical protein